MSEVLFSSFQFKFAQCHTWVMKKKLQNVKKLLNIFGIVYLFEYCLFLTRAFMELDIDVCWSIIWFLIFHSDLTLLS